MIQSWVQPFINKENMNILCIIQRKVNKKCFCIKNAYIFISSLTKSKVMKKPAYFNYLLVFLLGMLVFSCDKEGTLKQDAIDYHNENMITLESAERIAGNLLFDDFEHKLPKDAVKSSPKSKKKVESILEVPDSNNVAAYYIINYEEGGFVILAGDKRSEPVLAFSEKNRFNLYTEYFPSGLVGWLYSSKENIETIRINNEEIQPKTARLWDNLLSAESDVLTYVIDPPDEPDCTPYTIQKGPYIQTTWGQGCGYNSQTPSMSCGPCSHAYTGCVATAMAQIMKYHQYPTTYTWSSMPNSYGTTTTAVLMRNIGNSVSMTYNCDGSSADTKNKVAAAFKNTFGYSTASYADYNYQTVKNELNYNRPVILRGGRNTGWWIFGQYSDGHAWVCDGYLNYIDPCWGSILKFNMNWGWDGSYNGWYSFNNFNPGDYTFNYKTGMVYNIKP